MSNTYQETRQPDEGEERLMSGEEEVEIRYNYRLDETHSEYPMRPGWYYYRRSETGEWFPSRQGYSSREGARRAWRRRIGR